jgi:hypothetical protein
VSSVGPGLAARSVARAGLVPRRGLATATMRSDKRTASRCVFVCVRPISFLVTTTAGFLHCCIVLLSVRSFAAHVVPRHVWAFGSFIRPLCRSTSDSSRYPVNPTTQCPLYATLFLRVSGYTLRVTSLFRDCRSCCRFSSSGVENLLIPSPPFLFYLFIFLSSPRTPPSHELVKLVR